MTLLRRIAATIKLVHLIVKCYCKIPPRRRLLGAIPTIPITFAIEVAPSAHITSSMLTLGHDYNYVALHFSHYFQPGCCGKVVAAVKGYLYGPL